jgi:ATP-binding cassette subfamily F protein 3
VANGETTKYTGNYDHYVEARKVGHEQRLAGQKNQQRERERHERFIERFRAKNTKATQVKSRIKMLERMEEITVQRAVTSPGRIRLKNPARCGHEVVRVENMGLTYDTRTWVLKNVELQVHRGDKIAIIGPNGMGKSTLLRVLAGRLSPSEGKRFLGHNVVVGYQSQEFAETMDPDLTVFETLRRHGSSATDQDIRTLLGGFGFSGDAVEKRVSVLSGGEKVRLAFAKLLIDPPNFLILDEPTTHLDIQARESLEKALAEFEGTICLVSHDIEFVRHVATSTIAMKPGGIERYPGGYDYYCEKMAERESRVQKPSGPSKSTLDRKAERRERAENVQKRGQQRRELQKKLSATEKHIFELEEEQTALLAQLESASTVVDYAKVNRRLQQIAAELNIATELWEQQAEAVEEI